MKASRLDLLRRRLGVVAVPPRPNDERFFLMPSFASTARISTDNGSRYLQQLCKHWTHSLMVSFTPTEGTITFPHDARGADWPGDATLHLAADDTGLDCRLDASSTDHLTALKDAVERHLDRFAFREAPLNMVWTDTL